MDEVNLFPDLPGKSVFQFLQNLLILRVHRNRLRQHIIQMQAGSAVYHEGSPGNNVLVHLMQRIPELRHPYTVKVKDHRIEIPGILPRRCRPKYEIGDMIVKSVPWISLSSSSSSVIKCRRAFPSPSISNATPFSRLSCFFWNSQRNSVSLGIFIMPFPLK